MSIVKVIDSFLTQFKNITDIRLQQIAGPAFFFFFLKPDEGYECIGRHSNTVIIYHNQVANMPISAL